MIDKLSWLALIVLAVWVFALKDERRRKDLSDASQYIFRYPRRPVPSWQYSDDTLARLVYDYGLDEGEVEHLVNDGIHEAAGRYRKEHPLDRPGSYNLFETVFPAE